MFPSNRLDRNVENMVTYMKIDRYQANQLYTPPPFYNLGKKKVDLKLMIWLLVDQTDW